MARTSPLSTPSAQLAEALVPCGNADVFRPLISPGNFRGAGGGGLTVIMEFAVGTKNYFSDPLSVPSMAKPRKLDVREDWTKSSTPEIPGESSPDHLAFLSRTKSSLVPIRSGARVRVFLEYYGDSTKICAPGFVRYASHCSYQGRSWRHL
ncbi:hypothetical protein KM043_013546 [Ampulex compressa]|nr:hypothetical protein KM043_013546 [Ampulex compressa]